MITEHDLREAIAECQGVHDPSSSTCIKLAAYYTLLDHLYEPVSDPIPSYSFAEPPNTTLTYTSGTEFGKTVRGMDSAKVLAVIDEAMSLIQGIHPRLYAAVMEKLTEL